MLRARRVDDDKIAELCARFGTCRQTFYNLLMRFLASGSAGLLPEKRGPRNAWKLGPDVLVYAHEQLVLEPEITGASLASRLQAKFEFPVHKRTIEKILVRLLSKKKNP
jgi:transposase